MRSALFAVFTVWLIATAASGPLANAQTAGQALTETLIGPAPASARIGATITLGWARLNTGANAATVEFPPTVDVLLSAGPLEQTVQASRVAGESASTTLLQPGEFKQARYSLGLPASLPRHTALEVRLRGIGASAILIPLQAAGENRSQDETGTTPGAAASGATTALGRFVREAEPTKASGGYEPGSFFKEHFFGYEPFYFIAGPRIPNARFQVSLRYQLVNNESDFAASHPWTKGVSFAYTQTSLWDLASPSAPFFDTSYKPEMLYLWQRVDRGHWGDGVRLDLQGGLQHESNGKGGADSRSLNIAYLRPTLTVGEPDRFQFSLSPRAWVYVGDLDDNPDLARYRGYVDLRGTLGWKRGLQLSTTGRLGDHWEHGSLQWDLTYPMMSLLSGAFSVYLHAQYFTGYGESLLLYNQRSEAFRIGFGLYR